ncbi:hypothetical protein GCM10023318_15370 [Nocardia callitridis]|uniref:Uncharacterized protein n=1 Tax=Nocardia callitridis TaxID=648753 RepID=A0ABP9K1K8_9NOCA
MTLSARRTPVAASHSRDTAASQSYWTTEQPASAQQHPWENLADRLVSQYAEFSSWRTRKYRAHLQIRPPDHSYHYAKAAAHATTEQTVDTTARQPSSKHLSDTSFERPTDASF